MQDCERPDPPTTAPEKPTLEAMLDYHRGTLLCKVDGVGDDDLRRAGTPSGLTLLGLVKHLAYVERWWFRKVFAGEDVPFPWTEEDPDVEWRVEPGDTTRDILELYRGEVARCREIAAASSLDDLARGSDSRGSEYSLRWVMLHMIGETARHNGHADLLREMIDGATGE